MISIAAARPLADLEAGLGQRPIPKDSPLYPVFSYHLERLIALYDACKEES